MNMRSTQFRLSGFLSQVHRVKSVQTRSFFWSVFSGIRTEYGEILRFSPYSVRMWENTDQKKLRIWTLFTQWLELLSDFSDGNSHKNVSCYYPQSKCLDHQSPGYFQTSKCANPYYYLYYSNVTFSCRDDAPLSYNYQLNLSLFACRNFLFLLSHLSGVYLN